MSLLYAFEQIRNPFLNVVMRGITECGGEMALLVLAMIIFWCIDKYAGYYMLTVGFIGTTINQFLKIFFRIPRPWVKDPGFTIVESAREGATGYSFPSGHTQNVFATFGTPMLWWHKKKWLAVICAIIVFLVPISRMYLGVHTPLDTGVSFIIGLILIFSLYPMFRRCADNPKPVYILLWIYILMNVAFVLYLELYNWPVDIDQANLTEAFKNAYMMLFCSAGLLLTFHLDRTVIHFPTKAVWWAQILKVLGGFILVLAIRIGLKQPLLALCHGHPVANGIRYGLMIVFAGCVWPLTFRWFSKLGQKNTAA